jgi:hypothetical protein
MERRHILEAEKRIARQEALVAKLDGTGHNQIARTANEVLRILRNSLELSRERVRPHIVLQSWSAMRAWVADTRASPLACADCA